MMKLARQASTDDATSAMEMAKERVSSLEESKGGIAADEYALNGVV